MCACSPTLTSSASSSPTRSSHERITAAGGLDLFLLPSGASGGPDKRYATDRLLALERVDPAWPVSIVHDCADSEIWLDREARP
jgi:hypothetical protein